MEQSKAMEYERRKASSDVLKTRNIYIYIYIYHWLVFVTLLWLIIEFLELPATNCGPRWCSRYSTRYGLDGPGSESRWGRRDFLHPSTPGMGPNWPPTQWVSGVFPGGKAAGAWQWQPILSSAEVKERVQLYLYSPSGPSWPVIRWPLPATNFIVSTAVDTRHCKYRVIKNDCRGFNNLSYTIHLR